MSIPLPKSLVLIGVGRMGRAMLEGWLRIGMDPKRISLVDPAWSDEVVRLASERGMRLNPPVGEVAPAEVVVLATKPQVLDAAAAAIRAFVDPRTLVISILAGKTLGDLATRLPDAGAIVRAMPNLPASVGRGVTAAVPSEAVGAAHLATAGALLGGTGSVEWLEDEGLIDAVTAVSGSGPAYVFHMVECLAAAGVDAGLPAAVADRLARATVEGAGALLSQSQNPASVLRDDVTSPGGTTAAALAVLMGQDGLRLLLREAVAAAKRRAGELAG